MSIDGEIFSLKSGLMLTPSPASGGYLQVSLQDGSKTFPMHVHKAVLQAFVGVRPDGMVARHLDGDQKNNKLSNLVYGTPAENGADKIRHGTTAKGERNGRAKLSEAQALDIIQLLKNGVSRSEVMRIYGIGDSTVGSIGAGRIWKHLPR